ncbi:uncharacterized protein LOC101242609 [Ciona intestinalis]
MSNLMQMEDSSTEEISLPDDQLNPSSTSGIFSEEQVYEIIDSSSSDVELKTQSSVASVEQQDKVLTVMGNWPRVTEESERSKDSFVHLPNIAGVGDSGFVESNAKTVKNKRQSNTKGESWNWRQSIQRLKEIQSGKTKDMFAMKLVKQQPQENKANHLLLKASLPPGERVVSNFIVAKQSLNDKPIYICPLPARTGAHACTKTEGDCSYGIVQLQWQNGLSKQATPSRKLTPMTASTDTDRECCLSSTRYEVDSFPYSNNISCVVTHKANTSGCPTNVLRSKKLRKLLALQRNRQKSLFPTVFPSSGVVLSQNDCGKKFIHLKLPRCGIDRNAMPS